ncbi:response regulator [Cohnella zeiphila]|uniref:Response regulator n=1 Tax=Cohnella zeiphila TaxID=2761120 RepID=A0A7X0SMU1_9BACL|nr:response regulator [Cohnella zeiphila]MBB6732826.1 response regulator [Cohnella zeiphila]
MLKLLIVEDERWEREGLAEFMDWSAMGIGTVETACDGIEGLEKALELKSDIIITDIQMPGMNGIEMVKRIRESLDDVHVVVLTGYDDFEFAREAIRFQAVDYILKPVEEESMRDTLRKVVQSCEEARMRREQEATRQHEYEVGRRAAVRQAFSNLLTMRTDVLASAETVKSVLDGQERTGIGGYAIWSIRSPQTSCMPETDQIWKQAEELLQRQVLATEGRNEAEFALLTALDRQEVDRHIELASILVNRLESPGWTIGIGPIAKTLIHVGESYRQALQALQYAVWVGKNDVVTSEEADAATLHFTQNSEAFARRFRERAKQFRAKVGSGTEQERESALNELFLLIAEYPGASRAYVGSLIGGLIDGLLGIAGNTAEVSNLEKILSCERLDEMQQCAGTLIQRALAHLHEKRDHKDDYIVQRVIRLVEERYGSQELNLTRLASEVFISPNHLGMTFKKKTGMTIAEYIQEYRLSIAEELLRTTRLKVSVIAERVGIPNTSYFGSLFKQAHGITPGEYQETTQR